MTRTDPEHAVEASDPAAHNGPSRRVVTAVGSIVGILALVVGVLRVLGVGTPQPPVDPGEALDAAAGVVRQQHAETDVQAYVRAHDPLISSGDSILATCTPQNETTMSCTVLITGDGIRTDSMTVRLGLDGRYTPVGPR